MAQLNRHPLMWSVYNLTQLIEKCGYSEEITNAVIASSKLLEDMDAFFQSVEMKDYTALANNVKTLIEAQRCEWIPFYPDEFQWWNTGCGSELTYEEGLPPDFEKTPFCPCCSKRIEVKDGQG